MTIESKKNIWPFIMRCVVSALFIASATLKLFPIQAFEKTIQSTHYFNSCNVPIIARGIISLEFVLGILLLQKHFLKNLILPATIGILSIFCIHLGIQIYEEGNVENCGCMGELLPMTPWQGIIKNTLALGLLVFVFLKTQRELQSKLRFILLPSLLIFALVFILYPMSCSCDQKNNSQSIFSPYLNPNFEVNQDRKIVAVFNTNCEHCQETAKAILQYSTQHEIPPLRVLFSSDNDAHGEELIGEINQFFSIAGGELPFDTLDFVQFSNLFNDYPPRVAVLEDGKTLGDFEGDGFTIEKLDSVLQLP